ncbi:hypothetical protein ABZ477_02950 [Microbacterium sp. NPDC019599]|uniref:hypothetical protein n=1 Tax=Microbacterium sp. NPDC019599 TaxID=3154690 RepID=UPI0033F3DBA3
MTIIDRPAPSAPRLRRGSHVRLAAAATALWRVIDDRGRIIGHLEALAVDGGGTRFRARRFHTASGAFRDLGEFWSADDAVDCLRLGR